MTSGGGQSYMQGAAANPPAMAPGKLIVDLYFRHFATAYCAAFFGTLAISGILTSTATQYTPQTDKITLFYGMFNPCIWFDHYPAKVFATAGMGVFVLIGVFYSAMVYVYVFSGKKMLMSMWSGTLICFTTFIDLVFVNVFTTNLYPAEEPLAQDAHAQGGGRLLHGVHFGANNTISLLEETELSHADVSIIKVHTAYYILWIVGQLVFSFHMFRIAWEKSSQWTQAVRAQTMGLYGLGWFGMAMHAAAMLIIIMHPEPKVDWYFKEDLSSIMQHVVIFLDAKLFTSVWGWVPIMCFRMVMPRGSGIRLIFKLEETPDDSGSVMPEHWMSRCMCAMALVWGWGGIFDTEWGLNHTAAEKLMVALRMKPYAYMGAPALLACVIVLFVGLALEVAQKTLQNHGRLPRAFAGHAVLFFLSVFAVLLVILEKATWIHSIFLLAQVVFVAWVWHMNKEQLAAGKWIPCVAYTVLGLVTILASVFSSLWWCYFVYLVWIALYGYFVPDGPPVYLTAARIEESYEAVPQTSPAP